MSLRICRASYISYKRSLWKLRKNENTTGTRAPGSRLPAPGSRLPAPGSLLPAPSPGPDHTDWQRPRRVVRWQALGWDHLHSLSPQALKLFLESPCCRQRLQELSSELCEGQRRLSTAEKEKSLLQKTMSEEEKKIDELFHCTQVSEQKVREQAGSPDRRDRAVHSV